MKTTNIFRSIISIPICFTLFFFADGVDIKGQNVICDLGPDAVSKETKESVPQTCIKMNKRERCFYTYVPECASGSTPVVYDIHGLNGCAVRAARKTMWKTLADNKCFVIVWPTGNIFSDTTDFACWNVPGGLSGLEPQPEASTRPCCCHKSDPVLQTVDPDETNDFEFLRLIASYVVRDVPKLTNNKVTIDTKRIYMGGRSNGCIAAFSMAMLHSDFVAAVCCKSGALLTPPAENYTPVPIWTVHGKGDVLIPYDGLGFGVFDGTVFFPGIQATFSYLSTLNGCNTTETNVTEHGEIQRSTECERGADIQIDTLGDANHLATYGKGQYETTESAWEFCSSHQLDVAPILERIKK